MRGLPFRIAGELYALRLADIGEVLPLASLRPAPGAAPAVAGLLNLRGRLVPVIDLALLCAGRAEAEDLRTRLVLLPPAPTPLGLRLHTTGQLVDLPAEALQPRPLSAGRLPFLTHLSAWQGSTLQWMDPAALRASVAPLLADDARAAHG